MSTKQAVECVRVCVKVRPPNSREAGQPLSVSVDEAVHQVALGSGGEPPRAFTFDRVFGPGASQQALYDGSVAALVDSALAGFNATVFAYGQTGTGKTYTMEGDIRGVAVAAESGAPLPPEAGIIPRTFQQIFGSIGASQQQATFLVRASMYEVYNEEVRDLLCKNPKNRLELHETKDGCVHVKGLSTFLVKSQAEIGAVLEVGKRNRSVGATLMNQDSSRSHSVFTITIEALEAAAGASGQQQGARAAGGAGSSGGSSSQAGSVRVGKLNLVDLAGSERQSKTGAVGERLREATKINLSLSALGNVISALVDGRSGHIPYRDSKLTRLLQDSLGGNTRTVMIANVGPAASNHEETLSTLRYANRAKNIQNKPRVNQDPKDAMLHEFQEEIARLRAQLATAVAEGSQGDEAGGPQDGRGSPQQAVAAAELDPQEVEQMRQQMEAEMRGKFSSSGSALDIQALAQVRQDVQLAQQVTQAQAEQQLAARDSQRLEQQLQQEAARVQQIAALREQESARNAALAAKLHMLESKLLHGEQHGGLVKLAQKTAAQLSQQEAELRQQRQAEQAAAQRIALLKASASAAQTQYSSLQEEADALTAQLEAATVEYEAARQERGDVYAQWERDREDLAEEIRALHCNLALKYLVIDAFIPQAEVAKLLQRARYSAEEGTWSLASGGQASAALPKRPPSAALSATGDDGRPSRPPLLQLQLDLPERRVFDLSELQSRLELVYATV